MRPERLVAALDAQTIAVVQELRAQSCRMGLHDGRGPEVLVMSYSRAAFAQAGIYEQALAAQPAEPFHHSGHAFVRVELGLEYECLLELARADGGFAELLATLPGAPQQGPRSRLSPLAARS